MTDISDDDLKSRANYVEVTVNSIEQCARFCSLGSACDAFFVDSDLVCTYLPHVSLKGFELVDFVNYTNEDGKDMICGRVEDQFCRKVLRQISGKTF